MKKSILFILILSVYGLKAQECKTYALHYDSNEEAEYFCSLDPVTGEALKLNLLANVQMIQHSFSGIDPVQGQYFFYGIDANYNGLLYTIDINTGTEMNVIDFPSTPINGNIIEMHFHPFNNMIYALHWDNNEQMEYFVSFSPISGDINLINALPEIQMIQSSFSTLNYLQDKYYFMGVDTANMYRLYTLDINTGEILSNPITPSENINGGLNELEVDIYSGNLHSLHYDNSENQEYFTRIDPTTGLVTKMAVIPGVQSIQAGFSAINSNDGQYYFNGITEDFDAYIYTIDIYSGEVINQSTVYGDNFNGGLGELQFPNIEPAPVLMSQTSICNTDSALILAPEGFASYEWSNGSAEDHIYVSDSASYSLILSKDYGCKDTIQPMPLQVYNCEDYTDSILQMHDTCFFEEEEIAMSFLSDIELNGTQIMLNWNFISLHSDTITIPSTYEINENGLYELIMGFDCSEKSEPILFSNMLNIDHLNPTATSNTYKSDLKIFPNPTNDLFTIETSSKNNLQLKIFNNAQQLVLEKNIQNNLELVDISELAEGIYFLFFESEEGIISKKLIKVN